MVELPLEIIHHIVSVTLPKSSNVTREREDFLLPLCLVHSSIRRFAQRQLFTHPALGSQLSIDQFLYALEKYSDEFDFASCVRSLWMGGFVEGVLIDDANYLLGQMVASCREIREVSLVNLVDIDFANFVQLKKLHTLRCFKVKRSIWDLDEEETVSIPSLVNLVLGPGDYTELGRVGFFTPAALPSLRLFSAQYPQLDRITRTDVPFPSPSPLRHLAISSLSPDEIVTLIVASPALLSLQFSCYNTLSFPSDFRTAQPLIGIRMTFYPSPASVDVAVATLEGMQKAGMIDNRTVVFLPHCERGSPTLRMEEWSDEHDVELQWSKGALEQSWHKTGEHYKIHGEYASWVDAGAVKRETVAR